MRRDGTALAMALFAVVALVGVLSRPLLPVDETRYLTVAWEMHLSGDWLVPHLNGGIYTDKPPLLFWLINVVWSIIGVYETPARMIGPMFGVAAIGATGLLGRRLWPTNNELAGRAALVLACTGIFTVFAGFTMFDAMLTLAVVLGVIALTFVPQKNIAWLGLGAAMALGGLSKGPVVLVYLTPVALSLPLWTAVSFKRALLGTVIAIVSGVCLISLWLLPAVLHGGPAYRDAILWTQHAGRMVNSFAHVKPWWFFIALLPLLLWPWVWCVDFWKRLRAIDGRDPGLRLCMIWAGAALVIFSLISGKQVHYILPSLPAFALFFARVMMDKKVAAPIAAFLPALLAAACLLAATGLLPGKDVPLLAQPAWIFAITGLLMAALAAVMIVRAEIGGFIAAPGLVLISNLAFLFGAPGHIYDPAPIGKLLAPHDAAGVAILDQAYAGEFSFAGRLQNPVIELDDVAMANRWLAQMPGRVVLARLDGTHPDLPAGANVVFRNRLYGIWTSDGTAPPEHLP